MNTPVRSLKRQLRRRLPKDVLALARKRFGTPRPWDPGVILPPPEPGPGEEIGAPGFVGVGTQKSGTSWWYEVIASHPEVHDVAGAHKERHYFSRFYDTPFTEADITGYRRWFPRPSGAMVGEWTPQYMHQAWVPRLLAAAAPEAKLLVLLRDPIERYRSGLTHYVARDTEIDNRYAVDAAERGLYAQQLLRLYRHYDPSQVLVLQYERCRAEPLAEAARTFEFLGLDTGFREPQVSAEVNATRAAKVPMPDHLITSLRDLYQHDIEQLVGLVPDLDLDLWPNFGGRS